MCVRIRYLSFSFWHTSLCIIGSRFIHLIRTDSKAFLFMLCYAMLSHFSRVWLCVTPQTAAHQAPPSMGFSRQEYWSGVPLPSPRSYKLTSNKSILKGSGFRYLKQLVIFLPQRKTNLFFLFVLVNSILVQLSQIFGLMSISQRPSDICSQ